MEQIPFHVFFFGADKLHSIFISNMKIVSQVSKDTNFDR